MTESLDTSGRAVLFAGMIVCIAMLGMFALGVSFLYGVAVAATIAVSFTVISALTLLPALLGFFGGFVLRRRERRALREGRLRTSDESAAWARWTGWMQKRPAVFAAVATGGAARSSRSRSSRCGWARRTPAAIRRTPPRARPRPARHGIRPGYNGPLQLVARSTLPQIAAFLRAERPVARPRASSVPRAVLHPRRGRKARRRDRRHVPKGRPDKPDRRPASQVRDQVVPPRARNRHHVLSGGQTTS